MNAKEVVPYSLKDAPALIERLLPAQKLSIEAYKEQMANLGKTLTGLGSYWKGRKPLVLNKACILGALLPASENLRRDLEIFEMLMGMDDPAFLVRGPRPSPQDIVESVSLSNLYDYFDVTPAGALPQTSPVLIEKQQDRTKSGPSISWRGDVRHEDRERLELEAISRTPYRQRVENSKRPEQLGTAVFEHVWRDVNEHLGTKASNFPELVEQLGVMRFGHRPRMADTFAGSGQIPFEAARLGCDVVASDLSPVACMLSWGAFHVVGATRERRAELEKAQRALVSQVQTEINALGIDEDGEGRFAKAFIYCLEATCPETGWTVPLLPTRVVSKVNNAIVELIPDGKNKRYDIRVRMGVSASELKNAERGTVHDGALVHEVRGKSYRTKISTLRGDYTADDGSTKNRLRRWDKTDFSFKSSDIYRERLYAILWQRVAKVKGKEKVVLEFRSPTEADMAREEKVARHVRRRLAEWQSQGLVPDMAIEVGDKTNEPIRTRGWTFWHHLFNARQLLYFALIKKHVLQSALSAELYVFFAKALDWNSRISRWNPRWDKTENVFYNQALNTLLNYGTRSFRFMADTLSLETKAFPLSASTTVLCEPADSIDREQDVYVTDPPYGDAVHYEEILEYFIAWLRKNPPAEFANWVWDSRRAIAIKGEDEGFRRGMIQAYRRMTEKMPSNGIQIVMFTHQSGTIWGDMTNIVWASGLQVTAAWYVVTETESAFREGSYVKGTVLLVLRKREGMRKSNRSDLGWEIEEEVTEQVKTLTGLNQQAKDLYRDENLFSDSDLQMAGYAAALRVLTRYAVIDGKDMTQEAQRPKVKGRKTIVDELIEYAVGVANQALVPAGLAKVHWDRLHPAERFYLKMLELEAQGAKSLDNYQNFAKAFKVRDFKAVMASDRANAARLKSAEELGRSEMVDSSELGNTVLRGILYGIMELGKDMEGTEVLAHLAHNIADYYNERDIIVELADYLAKKLSHYRPEEASAARVLRDLVRNQRF